MGTIRLKNTSEIAIHGKDPGEEFDVAVDEGGSPHDVRWRKRLKDEAKHRIGAITVVPAHNSTSNQPPPSSDSGKDDLPKIFAEKAK